jgi:hypothetical protein
MKWTKRGLKESKIDSEKLEPELKHSKQRFEPKFPKDEE